MFEEVKLIKHFFSAILSDETQTVPCHEYTPHSQIRLRLYIQPRQREVEEENVCE